MGNPQQKKRNQEKLARLDIVADLYKKGHSFRQIRDEVMRRLGLASYSLKTVHSDVQSLLKEWRESRIDDIDLAIQLELERIDEACRELWEQWEKSKQDYSRVEKKQKGAPAQDKEKAKVSEGATIQTTEVQKSETNVVQIGNPAFLAEIRQQLSERRKLLGLYAPEKKDLSGNMSFAAFLMESGALNDVDK